MRRLPPFYKRLALLLGEGKRSDDGSLPRPYSIDELIVKLGMVRGRRRRDFTDEQFRGAKADIRRAIRLLKRFLRRAAMRESLADANKELATLMIDLVSPQVVALTPAGGERLQIAVNAPAPPAAVPIPGGPAAA
jgi:hypothetical protein